VQREKNPEFSPPADFTHNFDATAVGGYDLLVNPYTLISGSPQKGLLAEVKAVTGTASD